MDKKKLLGKIKNIAIDASYEILKYYSQEDLAIEQKNDDSPLTKADLAAHHLICNALKALTPEITIISEESCSKAVVSAKTPNFWLVDPLDGTKEFISKNGEFTVNIALIECGRPTLGVVALPAKKLLYSGLNDSDQKIAFCQKFDGPNKVINTLKNTSPEGLLVVGSRSHQNNEALNNFLNGQHIARYLPFGSSLKFCEIAKGSAHLYPRLGRTMEWDTAAGDAILRGAGGGVFTLDGKALSYGKPGLDNPHFVARYTDSFSEVTEEV